MVTKGALGAKARAIAALALVTCLTGCSGMLLDPQGPVGLQERQILYNSLGIMLVIVVPTIIATFWFAWWYRADNKRARYLPDWAHSGRVELVVWSIPIVVILFLGGVIWVGSHRLDVFKPLDSKIKPVEVQVVALDWKWLFIYPEQGVASVNKLVMPAGVPVHFTLTSASVMNGFFVPQLGSMVMAMNGMATQVSLQADKPGTYYGESTQFSGDGFSGMHFEVDSVPAAQFAQWASGAHGAGPVLDGAGYAELSKQSEDVKPFTYRAVDPRLFDAITTQKLPSAPGPQVGRPDATVSPRSES
ncbi:ubiquinol oxidase subunit II [Sphingomonas nostoxanthinifaciens]|nr:ubiquinol oxidase subunit II [Sphingomonas nostoxanthinifaciens]